MIIGEKHSSLTFDPTANEIKEMKSLITIHQPLKKHHHKILSGIHLALNNNVQQNILFYLLLNDDSV